MWHCAAATVLCQSNEPLVINPYPVTALIVQGYQLNKDGKFVRSSSIGRGEATFNYFRSIGIPVLLAKINRAEKDFDNSLGVLTAASPESTAYTRSMITAFQTLRGQGFQNVWMDTWAGEKDTKCGETPAKWVKDAYYKMNMSKANDSYMFTFDSGPRPPVTWKTQVPINPDYQFAAPRAIGNLSPGPTSWIDLHASTTIVMQYLHDEASRPRRVKVLQDALGAMAGKNTPWIVQARALANELNTIAVQSGKKVVLFNYRVGDVNRQHDGNRELLAHVRSIVKVHFGDTLVVAPILVGVTDDAAIKADGPSLDLYRKDETYDKRYTAAFWAIVANEMKETVFGLVGGRSGSMDIACFMGVNTVSWDEPIFRRYAVFADDSYGYVINQGQQFLRLLNQGPCMPVIYVEERTRAVVEDDGKSYNRYTHLNEAMLLAWLHGNMTAETAAMVQEIKDTLAMVSPASCSDRLNRACPADDRLQVDEKRKINLQYKIAVDSARYRMENEAMGVEALYLREKGIF